MSAWPTWASWLWLECRLGQYHSAAGASVKTPKNPVSRSARIQAVQATAALTTIEAPSMEMGHSAGAGHAAGAELAPAIGRDLQKSIIGVGRGQWRDGRRLEPGAAYADHPLLEAEAARERSTKPLYIQPRRPL